MDQKKVHISPDENTDLGMVGTEAARNHNIVSHLPGKRFSLYLV